MNLHRFVHQFKSSVTFMDWFRRSRRLIRSTDGSYRLGENLKLSW